MSESIVKAAQIEIEPLTLDTTVKRACRRLLEEDVPALPAVRDDGKFAGIFGEQEFMKALFPGYVSSLKSARLVSPSIDDTIDRRLACSTHSIGDYVTKDHVLVEDDFSDTELAGLFLQFPVLILPIATKGRVHAIVTRRDFFRLLVGRFVDRSDA